MTLRRSRAVVLAGSLLALVVVAPLHAAGAGDCKAYSWNVTHELGLMGTPAEVLAANENIQQAAMPLALDRHYEIVLHPQHEVGFVVPPGRAARDREPWGGIAYFHADVSGRYRIALDTGHWLDVIDAGSHVLDASKAIVVPSVEHEGQRGCAALRKVVAFDLKGGTTYRLHFSGRSAARVNVVVTRVGAGAPHLSRNTTAAIATLQSR